MQTDKTAWRELILPDCQKTWVLPVRETQTVYRKDRRKSPPLVFSQQDCQVRKAKNNNYS